MQFVYRMRGKTRRIICQNLNKLRISYPGNIPPWTSDDLPILAILQLQRNQLGEDKNDVFGNGTIPESLCTLNKLTVLDFEHNKLSGSIPNCWRNSSLLLMINLSSNKLSGVIPCSFGHLSGTLQFLHLNDNELHGAIPSCLSGVKGLATLDVGNNKLSGSVPSWLKGGTFSELNVLRLSNNFFNGTIPHKLCSLPLLRVLDLSGNRLTGNIPKCFGNLTGINRPPFNPNVNISHVKFGSSGGDPILVQLIRENSINETIAGIEREYSSILKFLTTIDLSDNHLEGIIPEELTKLSGLIAFILARNHLTGNIPEKIGYMKALETLDLSMNDLYGTIPPSLGDIDSLNAINLSFNNLSGPIPTNRHFDTLGDASAYEGNPYLCADFLPKKCSSHAEKPTTQKVQDENEAEDKHEKLWFYLVVMSGFATGFWGIIGTLWLNRSWRHGLFGCVEDVYDWLYVAIALKMSRLKKGMKKKNSEE